MRGEIDMWTLVEMINKGWKKRWERGSELGRVE